MLIFGLTGGIASGKSTVSHVLEELGCAVIDTDLLARRGSYTVRTHTFRDQLRRVCACVRALTSRIAGTRTFLQLYVESSTESVYFMNNV